MNTSFKKISVFSACVVMMLAMSTVSRAQDQGATPEVESGVSVDSVRFDDPEDGPLSVRFITVLDSVEMSTVHERLESMFYPMIIMQEEIFKPGIQSIRNLQTQRALYELRDRHWARLDSINAEKIGQYKEIIALQNDRIANFDSANKLLNEQIVQLDEQLDASFELTKKSLRGQFWKSASMGVLGGVAGFSVAVLLGVL